MNRLQLPGTGLSVSPLCLSGKAYGDTITEAQSLALLDRFVGLGGNFIDTARFYSDWMPGEPRRSERIIGDWLQARGHRDKLVISTKGAHAFIDSLRTPRTSATEIRDDLEGSLSKLRVEVIDLYWLHRDDEARPVEHFVDLLNAFLREGKIRAFGACNWTVARLSAANNYAKRSGQQGFVASWMLWSLGCQQARPPADSGLLIFDAAAYRFHRETGLAVVPFMSNANGFFDKLALPSGQQPADLARNGYYTPANLAAGKIVAEVALMKSTTPNAIVLAYLRSRPFPVAPIIDCSSITQVEDCMAGLSVRLSFAELAALESASLSGLPTERD